MTTETRILAAGAVLGLGILAATIGTVIASESSSPASEVETTIRPIPVLEAPPAPEETAPCCDSPDPAPEVAEVETIDVSEMRDRIADRIEADPVTTAEDALTRIVVSEEGFGATRDAVNAIATVAYNLRSPTCDVAPPRGRSPGITQCELGGRPFAVRPGGDYIGSETLLSALRRVSPRTTGANPPPRLSWRARWITTIGDGREPPRGWVECDDTDRRCHGTWTHYDDDLERIRDLAGLAVHLRPRGACGGAFVIAWGGEMDLEFLEERNRRRVAAGLPELVEVDCGDTRNRFYADPRFGAS